MKLNQKLDLQIKGEGTPLIRYPGDKLMVRTFTPDDVAWLRSADDTFADTYFL